MCYTKYVNSIVIDYQLFLLNTANSLINSFNFHESLSSYLNMVNEISIESMSQSSKILTGVNQITFPDISSHVSQGINSSAVFVCSEYNGNCKTANDNLAELDEC